MDNKITDFNEKYGEELVESLNLLTRSKRFTQNNNSVENFAFCLEEIFNVFETSEFNEYIKILNKIELSNPDLIKELEEYLIKEINLAALLGFHVGRLLAKSPV